MPRPPALAALIAALVAVGLAAARAETLPIEAVPLPPFGNQPPPFPANLLRGPDGALWFTGGRLIGRMAADRTVTYFGFGLRLGAMIVGPDDHLWATTPETGAVWRFTLQGGGRAMAAIDDPRLLASDRVSGTVVVAGSPSNDRSTLTRVTPDGALRPIAFPAGRRISGICSGPDGRVWIAVDDVVARLDDDDTLTAYATGLRPPPNDIAAMANDAAGSLWFTDWFTHRVTRLRPDGRLVGSLMRYRGLDVASRPVALIRGPQGSMWYTATQPSQLVRVGPDGRVSAFDVEAAFPSAIAAGSDGALWFTDVQADHLWRAVPPAVPPAPTPLSAAPRFYVGSQFFNEITALDVDGGPAAVWPVAREGFALSDLDVTPDGRTLLVALGYSVQAVDVRTQRVVRTYAAPGDHITLAPDGEHAYLWFRFTDLPLWMLDLRSGAIVEALGAGYRNAVTVGPDGRLYVPSLPEDETLPAPAIDVIDPAANRTVDTIPVPHIGAVFLDRAGARAYVPGPLPEVGASAFGFRVLDVATHALLDRQQLDCGIADMVPSRDDRTMYVVCQEHRRVDAYDVETRQIVGSTGQFRGRADRAALSPDGNTLAVVAYSDAVYLMDTRTMAFTRRIPESTQAGEPVSYEAVDVVVADPSRDSCIGDCDGDGEVTIAEVTAGVQAALAGAPGCRGYPPVPGEVGIGELVGAVRSALSGCADGSPVQQAPTERHPPRLSSTGADGAAPATAQ